MAVKATVSQMWLLSPQVSAWWGSSGKKKSLLFQKVPSTHLLSSECRCWSQWLLQPFYSTTFQGKCILTKSWSLLLTSRIWKLQSVLFIICNHLDCLRSLNKMFYNSYIRELMDEDYVDVWFDKEVGMLAMVDKFFHFTFFIITFFYHVITVYFHFFLHCI